MTDLFPDFEPPVRLCKDCRWAEDRGVEHWVCHHPTSTVPAQINLVTGEPQPAYQRGCEIVRLRYFYYRACGPAGRHWEPIGFGPDERG